MAKWLDLLNYEVGKRIRDRRIKMGFSSQEKFAEAIGVSRGAVAAWELGSSRISEDKYDKIKEVLKVDTGFFSPVSAKELINPNNSETDTLKRLLKAQDDRMAILEEKLALYEKVLTPENERLLEAISALSPTAKEAVLGTLKISYKKEKTS